MNMNNNTDNNGIPPDHHTVPATRKNKSTFGIILRRAATTTTGDRYQEERAQSEIQEREGFQVGLGWTATSPQHPKQCGEGRKRDPPAVEKGKGSNGGQAVLPEVDQDLVGPRQLPRGAREASQSPARAYRAQKAGQVRHMRQSRIDLMWRKTASRSIVTVKKRELYSSPSETPDLAAKVEREELVDNTGIGVILDPDPPPPGDGLEEGRRQYSTQPPVTQKPGPRMA